MSLAKRLSIYKAQENADEYSNEVQQLRETVARCEEEKQRLEVELAQIKEILQREVSRYDVESRRNTDIITEYKQICQRLEDDFSTATGSLSDLRAKMSKCEKCSAYLTANDAQKSSSRTADSNVVDPMLQRTQERVRELELELAQTKLAQVEAECRNQALKHKLNATTAELNAVNSHNWLSKTFSSIKKDSNIAGILRRDSAPTTGDMRHAINSQQRRGSVREAV